MLSLCGPHGLSMSSVFCSQDRTIISRICTYRLIFVTEAHCLVYEVGTELINAISINPGLKTLTVIQASETEHADRHGLLINNTRSQWIRSNKARLLFLLFMLWLRYGPDGHHKKFVTKWTALYMLHLAWPLSIDNALDRNVSCVGCTQEHNEDVWTTLPHTLHNNYKGSSPQKGATVSRYFKWLFKLP